jgi:hypothetical protein
LRVGALAITADAFFLNRREQLRRTTHYPRHPHGVKPQRLAA